MTDASDREDKRPVYRTLAAKFAPWGVTWGVLVGLAVFYITGQPRVAVSWAIGGGVVMFIAMFGTALSAFYNQMEGSQ